MELLESLKQRRERALEIKTGLRKGCTYFPVSGGLCLDKNELLSVGTTESGKSVFLHPVELNPVGTEAYGAAKEPFVVPYVLKHSNLIVAEFLVEADELKNSKNTLSELRPITLCLSLSIGAPIQIPFALDTSWATLPAFRNREVDIQLTDSGYEDAVSFSGATVTAEVASFVCDKIEIIRELLLEKRFQIAVDAYEECLKINNKKIAIATAWTGIEALFAISSELRFRTAILAAAELFDGDDPYWVYKDTISLYDARSKIVHGAVIKENAVNDAHGKSLYLLISLLRVIVQRESLRTSEEMLQSLLSKK